tara:strand:+ start:8807 stop:9124 length:318 start_codon:yes stop_codon:yes gene_type:complete
MKTLKQLERLRKMHKLIKRNSTGSPTEFSSRLHISERELYRMLEYLKELEAKISFSRNSNTYYYTDDFDLLINVSVQALVNEELKTIYAGYTLFEGDFKNRLLIS